MGTKVKVGSKAYIFHDQSTGITIKKGEIKELTPQQYNSKRIRSAINGGHLVISRFCIMQKPRKLLLHWKQHCLKHRKMPKGKCVW